MFKKWQYLWILCDKCWEAAVYQPVLICGYITFSYKLRQFFLQLQESAYQEEAAIVKFSSELLLFLF